MTCLWYGSRKENPSCFRFARAQLDRVKKLSLLTKKENPNIMSMSFKLETLDPWLLTL